MTTTAGTNVSLSFWVKWTGNDDEIPFSFSAYDIWFKLGKLGFNTGNNDVLGTNSAGLANRWVHIVGVFNNGNSSLNELYLDGVKQTLSQQGTKISRTVSTGAAIGLYMSGGIYYTAYAYTGSVGNVMIYNKKLTQSEVSDIYSIQKPGYP